MVIPTRANADRIEASWFNSIKDELSFSGAIADYQIKTADYTVDMTEANIGIDASSNTVQITLPAALDNNGKRIAIKVTDLTFAATIFETGNGVIYTFANVNEMIVLVSDNTEWQVMNGTELLNAHMADTSTHGVAEILGKDESAVMTNKGTSDTFNIGGDCTITGDLTVNGTATTINTDTLDVEDANITVNKNGNQSTADANNAGITIEMSDAADVVVGYDSTTQSKITIDGKEVLTASDTAIVTNKYYNGGTASNANKTVLPKNTTAGLAALDDTEAAIAYDTDLDSIVINDGTGYAEVSGGAGGVSDPSIYAFLDADTIGVADWDTSGLTNATFTEKTSTPLAGDKAYLFTNHASAAGEKTFYNMALPERSQFDLSPTHLVEFPFINSGTDDYIKMDIFDTADLVNPIKTIIPNGTSNQVARFNIASATTEIRIVVESVTGEAATLEFDQVAFKDKPFGFISTISEPVIVTGFSNDGSVYTANTPLNFTETRDTHGTWDGTVFKPSSAGEYLLVGRVGFTTNLGGSTTSLYKNGSLYLSGPSDTTQSGFAFTFKLHLNQWDEVDIRHNIGATLRTGTFHWIEIQNIPESTQNVIDSATKPVENQVDLTVTGTNGYADTRSVGVYYKRGDAHRLRFNIVGSFTSQLETTLSIDGVVFKNITNYFQAVTISDGSTAPTQSIGLALPNTDNIIFKMSAVTSDVLVSGDVELESEPVAPFPITYMSEQMVVAIPTSEQQYFSVKSGTAGGDLSKYVGSGDWALYVSKGGTGVYNYTVNTNIFTEFPVLNALAINSGLVAATVTYGTFPAFIVTTKNINTDPTSSIDFHHQIEAHKAGADFKEMGGFIGEFTPQKMMIVSDIKATGVDGGPAVAGSQTRDLNNISGDTLGSVVANQVLITDGGTYDFDIYAPAYFVQRHHVYLYNITDAKIEDAIISSNAFSSSSGTNATHARALGSLTLSSGKTFEVRHYAEVAKTVNGMGISMSGGFSSVYTVVKITKRGIK